MMGEAKRRKAAEDAESFAKVYRQWPEVQIDAGIEPGVYILSVEHDDDCPGLGTGVGCTCSPNYRRFKVPTHQ